MRSKGAEAVSTLEGDPPEDGGVSNSVPSGGISQWVSSTSASHTSSDMIFVNLEETFPPSPPFLERDPNMSSTARYSPLHGAPATLPSLPPIQHTSLLPTYQHETVQIKPINTNVYGEDNRNIISVESYSLSPSINANVSQIDDLHHSVISQYINSYSDHEVNVVNNNSLQAERLAPLLNAIDEVSCTDDIRHDANGGFYSQQLFVPRENFGITNNENVYLPSTGMSSECTSPNQRLTTSADIELVYSPNGEYNIIEENSMKTQQVELLINGGQSNIPYSLPKENGFIMTCSVDNSCDIVKNSGEINMITSIEDTMQYNSNQSIEMSEESDDLNLNLAHPSADIKKKIRLLIASMQNENLKPKVHSDLELDFRHFEKDASNMHIKENINILNTDKDENQKACINRRGRKQLTDIDISITCIPDKSVPCRAKASLPASHLSLCNTKNKESTVLGVFARRRIPVRARFGPLEGVRKPLNQDVAQNMTEKPVFLVRTKDSDYMIDVSDENMSNWMRYVRFSPGLYQNVCLQQLDGNLYFTSSKPIPPNTELLLGYGTTYCRQWGFSTIAQTYEPTIDWPCFECSMQFMSSAELQDHLNIHDDMDDTSVNKTKKKATKEVVGNNHCMICNKTFPRSYSLKRHMRTHEIDAGIITRIDKALEQSEDTEMEKEVLKPISSDDTQLSFNNQNNFNIILTEHSLDTIDGKMMDIYDIKLEENNSMDSISMISKDLNLENALQMYEEENQAIDTKKNTNSENSMEVEEKSTDKLSYCCLLCGKAFNSPSLLFNHARNEHRQSDGSYNCKLCSKHFPDYVAIRKHIYRYHNDQIKSIQSDCTTKSDKLNATFSCPHCQKQFKRKDKVKDHIKKQQRVINNNKEVIFLCAERAHSMLSDNQSDSSSYLHFTYKCHPCRLGFKRRGMLVNHLARRHPEVSRATVPELQLPIMRAARDYFCQHCDKVYKSSSKRKAHILKNHPGESLPPSSRDLNSSESKELEALGYSACVGAIKSAPHHCPYTPCHKQYASKAKLSQHIRHKHMSAESMDNIRDDKSSQNDNSDKDENKGENQFSEEAEVLQMNEDLMDDENIFIPSPEDDTLMSKIVHSVSTQRMHKSMNSFEIVNEVSVMLENSNERSDNFMDKDLSNDNYLNDFSNSLLNDKDKNSKTQDAVDFDKTILNEYVYNNQKNFPLMLLFSGVKMNNDKSDSVHVNILEKSFDSHIANDASKVHISGHIVSMETNKLMPLNIMSKGHFAENSYSSQYTDR